MSKDKIGLYCEYPKPGQTIKGCQKVVMNTVKGLEQLGIEVKLNTNLPLCGCLQNTRELQTKQVPSHALIGPEIMVFADDIPWMWDKYKFWTQPSQWVVDNMKTNLITKNAKFYPWPVGIDTDKFNENDKNLIQECFIYYKDVNKTTPLSKLAKVEQEVIKRRFTYRVLKYGSYKEEELIKATKECKFGILVTGTESQGIAYMEMLSSNVPLLVWDENYLTFRGREYTQRQNISSAPYFDDLCGVKVQNFDSRVLDQFISKLPTYKPREYILNNHTLKLGAQKYYDILLKIQQGG